MRGHDWTDTPLGAPENWPPALRFALATCLNTRAVAGIYWGPEFRLLYNDAYAPFLEERHPWALGRPMAEVWPTLWTALTAQAAQVLATGEGMVAEKQRLLLDRGNGAEETVWFYSFAPVLGEDGAVGGVLVTALDTTAQARDEEALRAASNRQAFRLRLEERLRGLGDPGEIAACASQALGQQLGAGQVAFGEVDRSGEVVSVIDEWSDGSFVPIIGCHRLAHYGAALAADLRRGISIAIGEVRLDARIATPEALAGFARLGLAALVNVPLIKEGRLVAILGVHHGTARAWSSGEVALAEEVAERVWSATQQAQAQATLRRSEARYRTLFEAIEAGFCIVEVELDAQERGVDHRLIETNPAFERQTDLRDVAGRWVSDVAPDMEANWSELYGRVALTGEAMRFENEAKPLSRWYDVHAFRTGAPEERRVAVLFNDITDRRLAEARLRDLNETLEARVAERTAELDRVWKNSLDLMVVAEADGTFRAVSPAWTSILGYTEAETVGRSFRDFVWQEDVRPTQVAVDAAAAGDDANGFENRYRHKDGSARRIAWRTSAEGGQIYGYGRDVTLERQREEDLAQAQQQLRQSQKMEAIGSLTGGVAHDFNNLLTPIIGSLDRLVSRGVGSERERRLVAGALESAERAKTLVQRLLAFARRQPLQPVAVDVGALVEGMAGLLGSTLGPAVQLRLDLAPDLPPALADANQLEMALLNLGVNARDAMSEGGVLSVAASCESVRGQNGRRDLHRAGLGPGRYIRLAVADTGSGMDAATLARAAEPFFSTKGIGQGTGLGLSMVHGLAAQLGGGLAIDSQPGQGTTVALWLPVSADLVGAAEPRRTALGPVTSRGTALLVDDEELVRMSTADMLAELGFTVLEVASAEDALHVLHKGAELDLLVTDHLMPGMSGAELVGEVGRLRPGLPALIVTGYAEVEGIASDLPRLTKPFRAAELAERVAAVMQDHGSGG